MNSPGNFEIRPATRGDAPRILALIQQLADYEKLAHEVVADTAALESTLFGEQPQAQCLLAWQDGAAVGMALYFFNYSTFLGREGLYLEDLFVVPAARGAGIGKGLLRRLAQIAVQRGCGRFEWSVLDWNTPAIEFYEALGAQRQDGWSVYRLTGAALNELADDAA